MLLYTPLQQNVVFMYLCTFCKHVYECLQQTRITQPADEIYASGNHVGDPRFLAFLLGKKHSPSPVDAGWLGGWWLVGWLAGWLVGLAGLAGWLGWLVGWLIGWLAGYGILVSIYTDKAN